MRKRFGHKARLKTSEDKARGRALLTYAASLPDAWLPGELEEHRRRMTEEPGYAEAAVYVRPAHFKEARR